MARTKWKKIIVAGSLIKVAVYPAIAGAEAPKVRQAKRKISSAAQQRMNQKYSYEKLELMLAANFSRGDLICTLTYDDEHLPGSRRQAEAKLKYFRAKLAAARKKRGQEMRMIWCTEHRHGDGRWHHHIALNATGDDFDEILRLWGQGEVEITKLRADKEKNYESLARYMAKEERDKLGQRCWSCTRSCRKPEVEVMRVEADTPLNPPKGALILEQAAERTQYGSYQYLKYLAAKPPKKPARRRRKK